MQASCIIAQGARVLWNSDFIFRKHGEAPDFDWPSLIIAGRQDSVSRYLDAMDLAHPSIQSTLAVLETVGHGLAFEHSEVFATLIESLLDPVEPSYKRKNATAELPKDAEI